jgi:hypothetical protein
VLPENIKYYVEYEGCKAILSQQIIYPRILRIWEFLSMCEIIGINGDSDKKLWRERECVCVREREREREREKEMISSSLVNINGRRNPLD